MKYLFLLATLLLIVQAEPLWKVFCSGAPLYRGRIDPIVNPGAISGHVHKVSGASNFSPAKVGQDPVDVYEEMMSSSCTTCSIKTVDMTAYWHPDLYYQWPNGTFSLVPTGGLTVYYLHRSGTGNQANPKWKAFPPGFRMLAGNPFRRSFNSSSLADRAINYACLSEPGGPETNVFPTKDRFCKNGLRGQVFFPMCWDGVNLDSPGHNQHVAYPSGVDGGNCPSTHPVRTPGVFFEAFYAVDKFPHGDGTRQPFVWANGDPTGAGLHGDFLSGWDPSVMQAAIEHPSCDITNTAFGNNVKNCLPLAEFVQETPQGACGLDNRIPLTEDMGLGTLLTQLPGCNPLTYGPQNAVPCSSGPAATSSARYHLKNVATGKYMTTKWPSDSLVYVNATNFNTFTFEEVFVKVSIDATWSGILHEHKAQYLSVNQDGNRLAANRGSASDWEQYQWVITGNKVNLKSKRNNLFLTVLADETVAATATTVTDKETWEMVIPTGGNIGTQNIAVSTSANRYSSGQTFNSVPTSKETATYSDDYGWDDTEEGQSGSVALPGDKTAEGDSENGAASFFVLLSFVLFFLF